MAATNTSSTEAQCNTSRATCPLCSCILLDAGDGEVKVLDAFLPDHSPEGGEEGVVGVATALYVPSMMGFFNIGVSNTLTVSSPLPDEKNIVPGISRYLTCPDCPTQIAKVLGFIVDGVENPDAGGCWLYSERVQVELGEE